MNSKVVITVATFILIISGTYLAIKWAQGYRFNLQDQSLTGNGLLVATSQPQGASLFIDGKLISATDDTIHLEPNNYSVRLEKDGFYPWEKNLRIEKELVTQTNARLFPSVPNLSALTVNSASKPLPSPDGHKIAYKISTGSAETKYGIWVLNLNDNPLNFGSNSTQVVEDTANLKFSQALLFWSPNSDQILAYFDETQVYLLDSTRTNSPLELLNNAFQLDSLLADWQNQVWLEKQKKLEKLPIDIQLIATQSATLSFFSPNEEKILYVASRSATLPDNIIPPVLAANSQPETRELKPGSIYVFDSKEDRNFLIEEAAYSTQELQKHIDEFTLFHKEENAPSPEEFQKDTRTYIAQLSSLHKNYSAIHTPGMPQWFPTSHHLVKVNANNISILEYDFGNQTPIFSGPFLDNFAYPWPNGDKMVILTSFSYDPAITPNLYSLSLK